MGSFFNSLKYRLMAVVLIVMAILAGLFLRYVDLRPEVTPEFFFGSNDPELIQSARIHEQFPSDEFLVISVAGRDIFSPQYYERLVQFSANLAEIPGISRLVSVATGPENVKTASESPFWRSLLVSGDNSATLVIAFLSSTPPPDLISEVEAAARLFDEGDAFRIRLSGMPYIVEQIRQSLVRDFKYFSTAAIVIFAGLLLLVFRSVGIVLGACASGVSAVFLTLLILGALGLPVGILTANLATIVFVLVQSQVIYLTANWRNQGGSPEPAAVWRAMSETFRASFWCMVTTLLGFATLVNVAAEPLRQLGEGGIVGSVAALLCVFLIYPVFLLFSRRPSPKKVKTAPGYGIICSKPVRYVSVGGLLLIVFAAVPGLLRINTDPSLLTYFEKGSEIHDGLVFVDENGGSSPLELVVRLKDGGRLDTEAGYNAMWQLHEKLQEDHNVGTVISLPALLAEANSHPLAYFLPWREIVSLLSLGINDHVAENFLNEDRTQVLYILRMKESGRETARNFVTDRLQNIAVDAGFEPVLTGGVYMLQGRLADLVSRSLVMGVIGLLALFFAIAWIVSRSLRITFAMTLTAALVPITILGGAGWFRVPVDIISAPAASVCTGIAVDALIHLAAAFRRHGFPAADFGLISIAVREQALGILVSSGVIAIGFLIFLISAFPPTTRFGGEIVLGAVFSGLAALTLFPMLTKILVSRVKVE